MKTIYLVRLRTQGRDSTLGPCAFVDRSDAVRYKEAIDLYGMDLVIEEVELYARNEWNPLPTLVDGPCV